MSSSLIPSILVLIISIVSATDIRVPTSTSLIRKLNTETCLGDMRQLEVNTNLAVTLESSLEDFYHDVYAQPERYCSSKSMGGQISLDCVANFEQFTPMYRTMCDEAEGEYYPISLFMRCYNDGMDLEMELSNVPSCLAHTCDKSEVNKAVSRLLEEGSYRAQDDLYCDYYHRTVSYVEVSAISEATTSDASNKRGTSMIGMILITAIGIGFYML